MFNEEKNVGNAARWRGFLTKLGGERVLHKMMKLLFDHYLISPVPYLHYVKNHSHLAFNRNFGPFINKLTYDLANFGLIKTISSSLKCLSKPKQLKTREIKKALLGEKVIYTVSPSLFERPDYWKDNLYVLGYHERKKTINSNPSVELELFLQNNSKVVLVTFGSMINTDPVKKTEIIMDIYTNKAYKEKAELLGGKMQNESFRMNICTVIEG